MAALDVDTPFVTENGVQRFTISLPKEAIDFLKVESNRTGSSMGDIVRRAIANQMFLQTATGRGADLLLAEQGKPTSKLVFR